MNSRLIVLGALAFLFLPCQGCFFSWLACTAGCRIEGPAMTREKQTSVLEAYVSRDGERLALHYHTIILDRYPGCPFLAMGHPGSEGFPGDPGEAWAHVDADAVSRIQAVEAASNPSLEATAAKPDKPGTLPADCVSRHCRWCLKDMLLIKVIHGDAVAPGSEQPCPYVEVHAQRSWGHSAALTGADVQIRWVKQTPTGDSEQVTFALPAQEYRKPAGYAALLLLPVTIPVDAVCWVPTLVVFAVVK